MLGQILQAYSSYERRAIYFTVTKISCIIELETTENPTGNPPLVVRPGQTDENLISNLTPSNL